MEVKLLMSSARESLKGRWGVAIAGFLIYFILIGATTLLGEFGSVVSLLIGGPFALGIAIFSLELSREGEPRIEMIFKGFSDFVRALISYFLMVILILLWTLLLIVPGIIAGLSYSLTFFILADDPSIKPMQAIDKSKAMMDGYKWKMFELWIYIFLLSLLCILTLGIGFLWLMPYGQVCVAKFYDEVKDNASTSSSSDEGESSSASSTDDSQSSYTEPAAPSPESAESAESVESEQNKPEESDTNGSDEPNESTDTDEDEDEDKPAD